MRFIESLMALDTKEFIHDISKELGLAKELEEELLNIIIKPNHFIEKRVKNRNLYLMTNNKACVNLNEIKSMLEL